MRHLIIVLSALLLFSQAQASASRCADVFAHPTLTSVQSRLEFERRFENLDEYLAEISIPAAALTPVERLGSGYSGVVWSVSSMHGKRALKILLKDEFSKTDFHWIVLQDALAKENAAPHVRGFLTAIEAQKFLASHEEVFRRSGYALDPREVEGAVLMDFSNADTLKTHHELDPVIEITESTRHKLLRDGHHHFKVMQELGIEPSDIDAVVLTDASGAKSLQMLDITFYLRGNFDRAEKEEHLTRMLDGAVVIKTQAEIDAAKKKSRWFKWF